MDVTTYQVATNNSKSGGAPIHHTHHYTDIEGISYSYLEFKDSFLDSSSIDEGSTTCLVLNGSATMREVGRFKSFDFSTDGYIDYSNSENIERVDSKVKIKTNTATGIYRSPMIDVPSIDKISINTLDTNKSFGGLVSENYISDNVWLACGVDSIGRTWMFYYDLLNTSHNSTMPININCIIYDKDNIEVSRFTHETGYKGGILMFGASVNFDANNNAILSVNIKGYNSTYYCVPYGGSWITSSNVEGGGVGSSSTSATVAKSIPQYRLCSLTFEYSTIGLIKELMNVGVNKVNNSVLSSMSLSSKSNFFYVNGMMAYTYGGLNKGIDTNAIVVSFVYDNLIVKTIDNGIENTGISIITFGDSVNVTFRAYTGVYVFYMFKYKSIIMVLHSVSATKVLDSSNYVHRVIKKENGVISQTSNTITTGPTYLGSLPINCSGLLNGFHFDESTGKLYIFRGDKNSTTVLFSVVQFDEVTGTFVKTSIVDKQIILTKLAYTIPTGDSHAGINPKFLIKDNIIHILFPGVMYDTSSFSLRYIGLDLEGNIVNPDIEVYAANLEGVHTFEILDKLNNTIEFIFGAGKFDEYKTSESPKGNIYKAVFSTVTTSISYKVFSREDATWYDIESGGVVNFTNPTNKITLKANMKTPSFTISPEIVSIDIDCIDVENPKEQYFISNKVNLNEMVSGEITLDYDVILNGGTVDFYITGNGGISWSPILKGEIINFNIIDYPDFRIKIVFNKGIGEELSPILYSYRFIKKEIALNKIGESLNDNK